GGRVDGEALRRRYRVRHSRRGRRLRHAGSVAAVGAGRGDRRGGEREREYDRRARDRQPGVDAVARQGQGDRAGVVLGPGRRAGDRRGSGGDGQSGGPPADHFPRKLDQTPRPELAGLGTPWGSAVTIEYNEGAEVGYRWFALKNERPMYAFGHGLSYTTFDYDDLQLEGGETITASFTVKNTGKRKGADVPQLYLTEAAGDKRMRLLGFERVELEPGESRQVTLAADPRLLARFDGHSGKWRIADGVHGVAVGKSAMDLVLTGTAPLAARQFGV